MTQTDNTAVSFTGAVKTTASRCWLRDLSAQGHAPGAGAIIMLTTWLVLFGSYAVLSYRRRAGTM